MQKVCEAGTPCFLGWQRPSGSNLKFSAGRSDVGCRHWLWMKQWLCMLQGILLWDHPGCAGLSSHSLLSITAELEKAASLSPAPQSETPSPPLLYPYPQNTGLRFKRDFTSHLSAVEMQIAAWLSPSKDPCSLSDTTSIPFYLIFLISLPVHLLIYSIINACYECFLGTRHDSSFWDTWVN